MPAGEIAAVDNRLRIVTRIPLVELWTDSGTLAAKRGYFLTQEDVKDRLRHGAVSFVVADCGKPLTWIKQGSYEFWHNELKPRLAVPDQFTPEDFPDSRCYLASEWLLDDGRSVIVLEMHH
jgi:hypothetical protein